MRSKRPIDALIPRTRQGILSATLMSPDRWWYLSDLAKHLGVRASSLQRELASLAAAGIFHRRRDGNRVYYRPDPACPFLPELRGLIIKTAGLRDVIRDGLSPLADRISWAFVYGSIARGEETSSSDIDLMVIGDVGLKEIAAVLSDVEETVLREINPVVYTRTEVASMLDKRHHFLTEVLASERLLVLGQADELEDALGLAARAHTRHEPTGAE